MSKELPFLEAELPPLTDTDSICYFLGAGFSRASDEQFPLSKGFFTDRLPYRDARTGELRAAKKGDMPQGSEGLIERVTEQYVGPEQALQDVDLEQVMTDMFIRAFGLGRVWGILEPSTDPVPDDAYADPYPEYSTQETRRDYENLLLYIRARLKPLDDLRESYALATRLAKSMKRQDSAVSLNYDTLLERHLDTARGGNDERVYLLRCSLEPPGSTYGGHPDPMFWLPPIYRRGMLMKLHGSLNWFACSNPSCLNHKHIQPSHDWSERNETYCDERHPCKLCGSPPQIVIVPPIGNKPLERFPKLALMWNQAHRALKHAKRWVLIGVSFAPTDFHLTSLVRSASNAIGWARIAGTPEFHICIVNRGLESSREVGERVYRMLAPHTQERIKSNEVRICLFDSFEQYLDEVERLDTSRKDSIPPN